MPYTIRNTTGDILSVVNDGDVNTTTLDLSLIGKNYSGYGAVQNENFVRLLENFASPTSPVHPIEGQLWWNKNLNNLSVYADGIWKVFSRIENSAIAPSNPQTGDLWFNTITQQLSVYSNLGTWVVIGPSYTAAQGISGAVPVTVWSTVPTSHTILTLSIGGTVVGVVGAGESFTLNANSAITGFSIVNPGLTLSSDAPYPLVNGYAKIDSPAFTGTPSAVTTISTDSSTKIATTEFVNTAVSTLSNNTTTIFNTLSGDTALLRIDVTNLIGNVSSRFSSVDSSISSLTGSISSVSSSLNALAVSLPAQFNALSYDISTNVSRIDGTISALSSSVDGRFAVVTTGLVDVNVRIDGLALNVSGIVVPSVVGFARLSASTVQEFLSPVRFTSVFVPTTSIEEGSDRAASTLMVQNLVTSKQDMWGASRKFVSSGLPGVNDGAEGDFWFQVA